MWSDKRWAREKARAERDKKRRKLKDEVATVQRRADASIAVDRPMPGESNHAFGCRKAWAQKLGPVSQRANKRQEYMKHYMRERRKRLKELPENFLVS